MTQEETSLGPDDVIVRAVQFFSTENWRPTTQSQRAATFQGKPPIPWFMLLLTVLGFIMCIVPGIIMYIMVIRKLYRFQNLVVTANSISGRTQVVIQYPKPAATLARRFLEALPPWQPATQAGPSRSVRSEVLGELNLPPPVTSLSAPSEPAVAATRVSRFCSDCGAKVEPGSQFCESCGARQ